MRDAAGNLWRRCEDPNCPSLEHPEDLHSHKVTELTDRDSLELRDRAHDVPAKETP